MSHEAPVIHDQTRNAAVELNEVASNHPADYRGASLHGTHSHNVSEFDTTSGLTSTVETGLAEAGVDDIAHAALYKTNPDYLGARTTTGTPQAEISYFETEGGQRGGGQGGKDSKSEVETSAGRYQSSTHTAEDGTTVQKVSVDRPGYGPAGEVGKPIEFKDPEKAKRAAELVLRLAEKRIGESLSK